MSINGSIQTAEYALATGSDAVGRLNVLRRIYSPTGRQALLEVGLTKACMPPILAAVPGS